MPLPVEVKHSLPTRLVYEICKFGILKIKCGNSFLCENNIYKVI